MSAGFLFRSDLEQGFNFKADVNKLVMHVQKFKIGDKELKANLGKIKDPTDSSKTVSIVGVGTHAEWDGLQTGQFIFEFNVDVNNKSELVQLTKSKMGKTNVDFQFSVYAFDDSVDQKKWYLAFHTNDAELKGAIAKAGDYQLHIDEEPDPTVAIPANYRFSIVIDPDQSKSQDVHAAFDVNKKQVFPWGVEQSS